MSIVSSTNPTAAAPIVSAERRVLRYGPGNAELDCLYVQVDSKSSGEVADFLASWQRCCDRVDVDWRSVRRPAAALVGLELYHCCGTDPASIRLVFDARRDRGALDALIETETLVVGSRPFGGFANVMAAFGVDGTVIAKAITAATEGLKRLVPVAS